MTVDLGDRALRCDTVVVTAGAWTAKLLGDLVDLPPLQVSAENLFHFAARAGSGPFIPFVHRGPHDIYGFDNPGEGVKVSEHYRDEWLDPDDRPFDPDPASLARVQSYIRDWLPGLGPTPLSSGRCLYTTTPSKTPSSTASIASSSAPGSAATASSSHRRSATSSPTWPKADGRTSSAGDWTTTARRCTTA